MEGQVWSELEVNVAASKAWKLYSSLEFPALVEDKMAIVDKIELIHGDAGVGSLVRLTFVPDAGLNPYTEKFTKIDDEKRIKEAEGIEGGFLDLGFSQYRIRFEIIEKGCDKCSIKSTIEYKIKEEFIGAASALVSTQLLDDIANIAASHLHST